ncbi:hypothetical protein F4678DRAFT_416828 [Xylaria arbuscula]|nr:hypothetical protein F4678DRAFT_416828 [Xylaria arbuscula]
MSIGNNQKPFPVVIGVQIGLKARGHHVHRELERCALAMAVEGRDAGCPDGTLFYTCAINHFHGCCSIDPCQSIEGCADTFSQLPQTTAVPSPIDAQATTILASTTTWATVSTLSVSTSSTARTTSSLFAGSTTTSTSPAETSIPTQPKGPSIGLVAGLSAGVGILVLASLGLFIWRRRARCFPLPLSTPKVQKHTICPLPPAHVFELEGDSVYGVGVETQYNNTSGGAKVEGPKEPRHEMAG